VFGHGANSAHQPGGASRSSSVSGPRGDGGPSAAGSWSVSGWPNSGQASLRHSQPSWGGNARVAGCPQVGQEFTAAVA
jgi:hypothetical protein